MKPLLPVAGIFLACGLAFLAASCASAPVRGAQAAHIRTYGIVAADDRGVLSPPEFDQIQIGLVQVLVSEGYVDNSQVFTPDIRRADIVFRVTIAWHGTGNSFAVVDVTPTYDGVTAIADAPAAPLAGPPPAYAGSPYPYDPWADDYYDYPDFGYGYGPYLPIFGLAPFFSIFDYPFHRRSYHADNRSHHHGVPWRDHDRRTSWSPRVRDHRPSTALVPLRPHRPDSGDRRLGWGAWHPRAAGQDHRPSSAKSPMRQPDRTAAGARPPSPRGPNHGAIPAPVDHRPPAATARAHPARPDHRPSSDAVAPRLPFPDHRTQTAVGTPRPLSPDRHPPTAAVTPRPPPADRRAPTVAVTQRPSPTFDRANPPPPRVPPAQRSAYRESNSRPPARVSAERSAPPAPRTESVSMSRRSDSGGRSSPSPAQVSSPPARTSSPPPDRSDSSRSRSVAESDRHSRDR